jgi:Fe-S-cluster containining protein
MEVNEALSHLEAIYARMPRTACLREDYSNECCTKRPSPLDEDGVFMPLPLVYGVEYINIRRFLEKPEIVGPRFAERFDFSGKHRLCPFKDPETRRCRIYPSRPFSCRVFGREVPPVFWGVEVAPEQARAVYCADLREEEPEKAAAFRKEYPALWNELAALTFLCSPFPADVRAVLERKIGTPEILVAAFGEYHRLCEHDAAWFEEYFEEYWKVMGNRL